MGATYVPTIGLEIHAELKTKTKMFCASRNNPDESKVNVNVCPVCLAHPGTLPVINLEAVRHVLRVGTALGSQLADYTEFDRKSYFYPDIPKGYQISQYEHPLVSGGELSDVAITRVHLEEDTARSSHAGGESLVDFNRAGVPLMELVTEPVIHDAQTAGRFARELQLLLRTLGVSDANLEKGEMRIEANISVSAGEGLGTKVEVKNLNSFRSVERAIAHEIERQTTLIEEGGSVVQETRGWDEGKQETFHQRFKEGSADYRYFPDPDLPKLVLSEVPGFSKEVLSASLPVLPNQKRDEYVKRGASGESIETLLANPDLLLMVDAAIPLLKKPEYFGSMIHLVVSDVIGTTRVHGKISELFSAASIAGVANMFGDGEISSRGAKDVLSILVKQGGDAAEVAKAAGLIQVSDKGALATVVQEVLAAHPSVVAEYKAGKEASLQYLVGQTMKATKGAGNPGMIREVLIEHISSL